MSRIRNFINGIRSKLTNLIRLLSNIKNKYRDDPSEVIGNIGGIIGVCVGISIIVWFFTIIEFELSFSYIYRGMLNLIKDATWELMNIFISIVFIVLVYNIGKNIVLPFIVSVLNKNVDIIYAYLIAFVIVLGLFYLFHLLILNIV